jgi:hypothetical protein
VQPPDGKVKTTLTPHQAGFSRISVFFPLIFANISQVRLGTIPDLPIVNKSFLTMPHILHMSECTKANGGAVRRLFRWQHQNTLHT